MYAWGRCPTHTDPQIHLLWPKAIVKRIEASNAGRGPLDNRRRVRKFLRTVLLAYKKEKFYKNLYFYIPTRSLGPNLKLISKLVSESSIKYQKVVIL